MKIPIQYKVISNDYSWESEWQYWEIDVNFAEYCVHKWLRKKKEFHPKTIPYFLFFREFYTCRNRIEANKTALLEKVEEKSAIPSDTFIDWEFYEEGRENDENAGPFIHEQGLEVDRMLRQVAKSGQPVIKGDG